MRCVSSAISSIQNTRSAVVEAEAHRAEGRELQGGAVRQRGVERGGATLVSLKVKRTRWLHRRTSRRSTSGAPCAPRRRCHPARCCRFRPSRRRRRPTAPVPVTPQRTRRFDPMYGPAGVARSQRTNAVVVGPWTRKKMRPEGPLASAAMLPRCRYFSADKPLVGIVTLEGAAARAGEIGGHCDCAVL